LRGLGEGGEGKESERESGESHRKSIAWGERSASRIAFRTGESACPTFSHGGSWAGASAYPTFDGEMGGIRFHLGSF
jgi:hypothetical protein